MNVTTNLMMRVSVSVSVPVLLATFPGSLEGVVHDLPRPLPHRHLLVRQEAPLEGRLDLLGVHLRPDDDEFLSKKENIVDGDGGGPNGNDDEVGICSPAAGLRAPRPTAA